jgi:hypothetical protein
MSFLMRRNRMKSLKLVLMVAMLSMALLAGDTAIAGRASGGGGGGGGYSGGGGGKGSASGGSHYSGGSYKGGYYGGGGYKGGHYGGRRYYGGGYYGGRRYYGGYYGSGVGFWFGWPYGYPYYPYYYPYSPYYYPYYSPPVVTVPSEPQEYIQRPQRSESTEPFGVWYYCSDSKAYYPYVKECPGGWQTVPAQPPADTRR